MTSNDNNKMTHAQLDHSAHQRADHTLPLCYLVQDMSVPNNVGGLFRIADALGVEKIYLTGSSVQPPNAKIRKTSRATEKYVAFRYARDAVNTAAELKAAGYTIIGLEITSQSIDIAQLDVTAGQKICLVLGSEKRGISQALLSECAQVVHIPMMGVNSSMNVTNACAIASYELARRFN